MVKKIVIQRKEIQNQTFPQFMKENENESKRDFRLIRLNFLR